MTKSLLWLLPVALLAALFQPIVCPSGEMFTSRRDRSSHIDTSQYISDNLSNLMDINQNRSRKPQQQQQQQHQQQQHQYLKEPNKNIVPSSSLNDTIHSIFQLGTEKGLTLFNRPTEPTPTRRTAENSGAIIFPRPDALVTKPKCEEQLSGDKPFCTKVSNYPEQIDLERILWREFSKLEVFFGEDLAQPLNVTQRMNYEPDEEYLCRSVEKIVYPKSGITKDSDWLFIVNNDNKFKQGVRVEECVNMDQPCNFKDIFPNHYKATCKQHYIYRSMVAISTNGTIIKDHFKMPSCCKCVLKQERNF